MLVLTWKKRFLNVHNLQPVCLETFSHDSKCLDILIMLAKRFEKTQLYLRSEIKTKTFFFKSTSETGESVTKFVLLRDELRTFKLEVLNKQFSV